MAMARCFIRGGRVVIFAAPKRLYGVCSRASTPLHQRSCTEDRCVQLHDVLRGDWEETRARSGCMQQVRPAP
jgi:hypothetical protein